ncbi:MAG: pullulanase-type alpha-1,6-glucosidase, partial [Deltaproteobacteria bacterium]|nr:pullulanase-type alpha-1,6-glucosidase [Deltaproteobacteria bacterium]
DAKTVGIIVHRGDEKDPGPDMTVELATTGNIVFLVSGSSEISPFPLGIPGLSIAGAGAHWLDRGTLAWNPIGATSYELRYAADGSITTTETEVTGGTAIPLTKAPAGLSPALKAAFPHLSALSALTLPTAITDSRSSLSEILQGELVAVAKDGDGKVIAATRVQIPGVLDDLFTYEGPLGLTFAGTTPSLALWAPTAQLVRLLRYDAALAPLTPAQMTRGDDGVWRVTGDPTWAGTFYRYEVKAFHPVLGRVATVEVTDPYSTALSTGSKHTLIADLTAPALAPAGWADFHPPQPDAPEDIALYELHVRDFSVADPTVPAADRGHYRAFTYNGQGTSLSDGMRHLAGLASAGVTHLHLLPTFDIATIDEDASARVDLDTGFDVLCAKNTSVPRDLCTTHGMKTVRQVLAGFDPKTSDAQALMAYVRPIDSFNWGYDPFHYNVPEGSYASQPNGTARIVEYRQMVQALGQVGLGLVIDVVYNHTNASGVGPTSVLDKVVPGYYHRLNPDTGLVETSTCCANTATEHAMMRRLMIDSALIWARQYKVAGLRFDLMGHHMKADMQALRAALDTLTIEADGVDGKKIYVYGEGWNFGEVASNARGVNATQNNMAGTGIGTFNDRLRDAVRGGSAFDSGNDLRKRQGFGNGLYAAPNELAPADATTKAAALLGADLIRVGMAGGLKNFRLTDRNGNNVTGFLVGYNGANGGYTLDPQESINYVEKHDNQTLFDIIAYKAKTGTTMADRVRMQVVSLATILLGQGVPFIHAGSELLRSKSMERDSYDSGDWWNALDPTLASNRWNVGLPREDKDGSNWALITSLLADAALAPKKADFEATRDRVKELLAVRKSSPLFRLQTEADVKSRLLFHNTGPSQTPGLITFTLSDATCAGADLDPTRDGLFVAINARPEAATTGFGPTSGWTLHPTFASSVDTTARTATFDDASDTFTVPAWSAAVFVLPQGGAQGTAPACNTL